MFGLLDTQYIDFVDQQTDSQLRSLKTRAGMNVADFIRAVDSSLASLNRPDPLISMLAFQTERDRIGGKLRGSKIWQRSAEYSPARPQRGQKGVGHLLPLHHNEIAMGFTYRGLQEISQDLFLEEQQSTIDAIRLGRRADHLERLFDADEQPLDDDGNGACPGFAGSGTGSNVFQGQLPNGTVTDSTYTHYGYTTEAALETALDTYLARVAAWHAGPFDLIGSPDAIAMVTAISPGTKFVPTGSSLVRMGEDHAEALVDPTVYVGVYGGTLRVRHGDNQISGDALAIVKSYGADSPRNPLAQRYDPLYGKNAYVEDRDLYPLVNAQILQPYGIGPNDRTAAAMISIGASQTEYTAPTILR